MKRLHIFISGAVQGVGFRWYVESLARRVGGITGFVRNLPDGRVEIVAEGTETGLERFWTALESGRLGANITGVEKKEEPADGQYTTFSIAF